MPPISVLIKPASSLCNMACEYCFYKDVASHRNVADLGIMDYVTHENLVKNAMSYAQGSVSFAFQGGEPTLAGLGFFQRHIELCKKYSRSNVKIFNSLQTNGYIIDETWAEFFFENKFLVGLSLDGPKEIHDFYRKDRKGEGTFNRIRKTINIFDRFGVEYNLLCVVTESVAKNANKVLNFFINSGFDFLQFIPCLDGFEREQQEWSLSPSSYADFLIKSFIKYYSCFLKKKFLSIRNFDNYISLLLGRPAENCGMNGVCSCYFVVEGNGSVYPCDFYVTDKYCAGNVNLNSFEDIARSEIFSKFIKKSLPVSEECKDCKWFSLCRGGCRRYREPFSNEKPSLNFYCQSYKSFFNECGEQLKDMANSILNARRY